MRELFQPETLQDTCNFCHSFNAARRAVGSIHYDDDSELTLLINKGKLNIQYFSADLSGDDIDEDFKIDYCPMCGRKLND